MQQFSVRRAELMSAGERLLLMTLLLSDSEMNLDKEFCKQSHDLDVVTGIRQAVIPGADYTVKIVLTLTVGAPDREQAEVLANHVAAFLPEDAQRIADAFSPIIMVPTTSRVHKGESATTSTRSTTATASVTMVTDNAPEGDPAVPLASTTVRSPRSARSARFPVRSAARSSSTVYTRRSF
jgi:orotate phosphoribosyltransferase-like protein